MKVLQFFATSGGIYRATQHISQKIGMHINTAVRTFNFILVEELVASQEGHCSVGLPGQAAWFIIEA
jgi:hypothetical protein